MDNITYIYMYNPFDEQVMKPVMEKVGQSMFRNPRTMTIIYKNPLCHENLIAAGFSHVRDFKFRYSDLFSIYNWQPHP
ncbi:MAG TPA: hypothetical protein VHO84_15630 [Syntrophorhabdaceae bacterium]|nr:hypothetical protein [Syntrophorhabdaceae bacterium]